MEKGRKIAVIIAAAGLGTRMGQGVPKQYLNIGGRPMLLQTAKAFAESGVVDELIVVASEEWQAETGAMLRNGGICATVVCGGAQRQDSVYAGLLALSPEVTYVLIHDGARPYVTPENIRAIALAVVEKSAVVCAVPVKDTIRRCVGPMEGLEQTDSVTMPRSELYAVQTPQAFEKNLILRAHEAAREAGFYGTDDAVLVERIGARIYLIPGDYGNIKITTKEDIQAQLLAPTSAYCAFHGAYRRWVRRRRRATTPGAGQSRMAAKGRCGAKSAKKNT